MKKILVVLALVAFSCGLGFSVTGNISTVIYTGAGQNYGAEDDFLSAPEMQITLDFGNGFTFQYITEVNLALQKGIYEYWGDIPFDAADTVGAGSAGGPGRFVLGFKPSDNLTIGLGLQWFTYEASATSANSNTGDTNNNSQGYNYFKVDPSFTYKASDTLSFGISLVDRFWTGSSVKDDNAGGITNNVSVGGLSLDIEPSLTVKMGDALTLTPGLTIQYANDGSNSTYGAGGATTNTMSENDLQFQIGSLISYKINDTFKIDGGIAFSMGTWNGTSVLGTATNTWAANQYLLPIQITFVYTGLAQFTFYIGGQYNFQIGGTEVDISGTTTNTCTGTAITHQIWGGPGTPFNYAGAPTLEGNGEGPMFDIGGDYKITDNFIVSIFEETRLGFAVGSGTTTMGANTSSSLFNWSIDGWASGMRFKVLF